MKKLLTFNFKLLTPAQHGVTLYIAIAIMSVLLFVSFAVVNITIKSTLFASSGRDSQTAFFAADAGAECAMFWDITTDKFATSSPDGQSISCFNSTMTSDETNLATDFATNTLALIGGGGDGGGGGGTPATIARVGGIIPINAIATLSTGPHLIQSAAFNAVAGNLIVVAVRHKNDLGQTISVPVIDTAGNTYTRAVQKVGVAPDWMNIEIWYAKNITPHATNRVTANFSAATGYRTIGVVQYSGIDTTSPLGAIAISTRQTTDTVTSNDFDTPTANEVIVASAHSWSGVGGATYAHGPDFSSIAQDAPNGYSFLEHRIISSQLTDTTAAATKVTVGSIPQFIVAATFKAAIIGGGGGGRGPTSVFGFKMNTGANQTQGCAVVTVNKKYVGSVLQTHIESRGYNTCDSSNPRRVERGVEITY